MIGIARARDSNHAEKPEPVREMIPHRNFALYCAVEITSHDY